MDVTSDFPLLIMGCDERYCFALAVAMYSALISASRPLRVIVLGDAISASGKKKLQRVAQRGRAVSFNVVDVDLTAFRTLNAGMAHLSPAAFSRILIPELFPDQQRCIWVDSDTLVTRDLLQLWNTDLHGLPVGAVQCYYVPSVGAPFGIPYFRGVRENPGRSYLNSGIVLFDLHQWRNENLDHKVKDFLAEYSTQLLAGDQDILNAVLIDHWEKLPACWNDQEAANRKITPVDSAGHIRHFSGPQKPWNSGLVDPDCARWIKTAGQTGFHSPPAFLAWRLARLPRVLKGTAINWLKRRGLPIGR